MQLTLRTITSTAMYLYLLILLQMILFWKIHVPPQSPPNILEGVGQSPGIAAGDETTPWNTKYCPALATEHFRTNIYLI